MLVTDDVAYIFPRCHETTYRHRASLAVRFGGLERMLADALPPEVPRSRFGVSLVTRDDAVPLTLAVFLCTKKLHIHTLVRISEPCQTVRT